MDLKSGWRQYFNDSDIQGQCAVDTYRLDVINFYQCVLNPTVINNSP